MIKINHLFTAVCIVITGMFFFSGCELNAVNEEDQTSETAQLDESITDIQQSVINTTVTTESALKSAVSSASAGSVITISGTINLTSTLQLLNSGTSSAKINLTGGTLNCSGAAGWGVKVNGSYWNITNMNINNAKTVGICFQSGGNNYVNNVNINAAGDTGYLIYNGAYNVSVNNSKSQNCYDSATGGQNADGFSCKLSGGAGNKFTGCTAYHNSDDGFDLYGQPYTVIMTSCTATNNGYGTAGNGNGFKLGKSGQTVAHSVINCTSSNNKAAGYDGNGNTGHITTTGSGGSGNGTTLWYRIY
jgi:hypothetical protein